MTCIFDSYHFPNGFYMNQIFWSPFLLLFHFNQAHHMAVNLSSKVKQV